MEDWVKATVAIFATVFLYLNFYAVCYIIKVKFNIS